MTKIVSKSGFSALGFPAVILPILLMTPGALAQLSSSAQATIIKPSTLAEARQTGQILGLDAKVRQLAALEAQHPCGSAITLQEVVIRQELLESVQTSILDIDGVVGEIATERGELGDLKTALANRRDKTVAHLNAAALLVGSGVGVAVGTTQFSSLSDRTQDVGTGIGIGAGVASAVLSVLALRRAHGPTGSVENDTPNMLAPLLGGNTPGSDTYYPPAVLQYLNTVPAGDHDRSGTRLDQMKDEWVKADRLSRADTPKQKKKEEAKIAALTVSKDPQIKVSIDDLTDRIAMLRDVSGSVALMKRDLDDLMRSYLRNPEDCQAPAQP